MVELTECIANLCHLVDIVGDATRKAHIGLTFLEETPVGGCLDASVLHIAKILHVGVETCGGGDCHGDEGIMCAAVVEVKTEVQPFP